MRCPNWCKAAAREETRGNPRFPHPQLDNGIAQLLPGMASLHRSMSVSLPMGNATAATNNAGRGMWVAAHGTVLSRQKAQRCVSAHTPQTIARNRAIPSALISRRVRLAISNGLS
jgi:hypothetical protein